MKLVIEFRDKDPKIVIPDNRLVAKLPTFTAESVDSEEYKGSIIQSANKLFIGHEDDSSTCNYFEAVVNKENGKLLLTPLRTFSLISQLPQSQLTDTLADTGEKAKPATVRELCQLFGSRKVITALATAEKRVVTANSISAPVANRIEAFISSASASAPAPPDIHKYSSLPPFSLTAEAKQDCYPLPGLLCLNLKTYLKVNFSSLSPQCCGCLGDEEVSRLLKEQDAKSAGAGGLNSSGDEETSEPVAKALPAPEVKSITLPDEELLTAKVMKDPATPAIVKDAFANADDDLQVPLALFNAAIGILNRSHDIPNTAGSFLARRFKIQQRDSKYFVTSEGPLMAYTLVLAWHLLDFRVNVTKISSALRKGASDIKQIYRGLGAIFQKTTDTEYAALKAPLVFSTERHFRKGK